MADNVSTKNQVKEIAERLEQGVKELFESDKYKAYLKTMSRFPRYSTRNTLLIHMQMPEATHVAGYRAWEKDFGRYVMKGERGIRIFAPKPFTVKKEQQVVDPDTNKPILGSDGLPLTEEVEKQYARYRVVYVFDVSQTDGKPLPSLVEDLTGDVRHYELFMDTLRAVSPLPIVFEALDPDTDGVCRYGNNIAIREGMSEIQTVSAAIHEIAHARLHDINSLREQDETVKPKDRRTKEVEAESVSYAVCQYYGIETGANSFGYLAEWSKSRELKELNASLDTIRKAAADLIEGIDKHFLAFAKERGIDLTVDIPTPETATEPNVQRNDRETSLEHQIYNKFADLFPQFMSGEYSSLRLEAEYAKPLVLEWVFGDLISIAHSYELNGEPAYEPRVFLSVNREQQTLTASSFELSEPPRNDIVYQEAGKPDVAMQQNINSFTSQWLDRAAVQGFKPVEATIEIGGEDIRITFDADGNPITPEQAEKQYELGFGYMGNGLTVWNRLEEKNNDYVTVAHIDRDRSVTIYDKDMPEDVRARIEETARTTQSPVLNPLPEKQPDYEEWSEPATAENAPDQPGIPSDDVDAYLPEPDLTSEEAAILAQEGAAALRDIDEEQLEPATPFDIGGIVPDLDVQDEYYPPDAAIGLSERDLFGYTHDDMLPLTQERASELFAQDMTVYMLYPDNTEAMVFDGEEITAHDGIFGIDAGEWRESPEYKRMDAERSEGTREAALLYGEGNAFGIYQLKGGDELHYHRFTPLDQMEKEGLTVDRANYELVYTAPLTERIEFLTDRYPALNKIYDTFNTQHPEDFTGHSLSVSDVIVLKYNGDYSSHFVDSAGFVEIDAFLGGETRHEQAAEAPAPTSSQVGNMSQSPLTDGPTVAELKAEVDAGRQISLIALANAVRNERQQDARKERPSLLAQLQEYKNNAAQGADSTKTAPKHDVNREV